ncbi:MAG: GNAT family N-acetyltransferase [Streptosporangiaceae bacterium]
MDNKSAEPVPPFHVRQLTIEDGLTLAASPQPAAWQVYDALEPFPPDEGYWAVADSQDALLGFCCLGEPARAPGETGHPAVLDIAIGIRSDLSGRGLGVDLGRAAVAYARSVALDRRLRTTVPEWNAVGLHVAEQSGFVRSGALALGGHQYIVLEQDAAEHPVTARN